MCSKKMIQVIVIVIISQLFGTQGEFEILVEDVQIPLYSTEYFTEPDVYINENNEGYLNGSLIKQLPMDCEVHFLLIAASLGEYVIETGIDVRLGLCETLDEPILVGPILHIWGLKKDECPPPAGVYGTQGRTTPMEGLPDNFPPNKYLAIYELWSKEIKLLEVEIYVNIQQNL